MKKSILALSIYAGLMTYPAYLQMDYAVNGWLDQKALERVEAAIPDHIRTAINEAGVQ